MTARREPRLIRRGVLWLLLLGPLFFISYGLSNTYTATRSDVGTLVFDWESQLPLWPWTIIPYWSIDLLYGLAFLLPLTRREMDRHALALLTAQCVCVMGFLLWPLRFTFDRPALDGGFGWMFDVLMGFDKPFNQAPSLHIALLVIIWTMFARHVHAQPWRWLVHGWMALIGVSVLTTWQHHFIDVPSGALVGLLCLWLWPAHGALPWQQAALARDSRRWRLAAAYGLGAGLCAALALTVGGLALCLLWPAVSLLLVALNYAWLGAAGFQKGADGRLSMAATLLLAPYLAAAALNAWCWTHKRPQADEVCAGVFLGRVPSTQDAAAFAAVVDLSAERPCTARIAHYRSLPSLDLVAPDRAALAQAAAEIETLRHHGPLLVCCALGYSRSASAVAAWLLLTGRSATVAQAEALIRHARPGMVLHDGHRRVLGALEQQR
ncbi:phosphatase PAP2/dual specificity phosphatase family protein [Pseudomonas sp. RP23018S]|uniref:phosphatase PAP2/dual specificity phosphatase family protein n=1 Tax=Pseudomonas sp. RP23018S TaxID=3096037 RepID=UPI002ACA6169|nr:phosphatase PAP2/dual specificity phosphatase family protein [Pseudomonas sp. RP23018S]MDZ5604676.1 phosphatase PAP2/dual specificity phosphatase family protein [Pseudomonas sp. RP23018S]